MRNGMSAVIDARETKDRELSDTATRRFYGSLYSESLDARVSKSLCRMIYANSGSGAGPRVMYPESGLAV